MSMINYSRALVSFLFLSFFMVATADAAGSQNWPARAVHVVVPLPPGIPTDLVCRLFAERLSERWHQPVVVENRQGADGIPAVTSFVATHDDHTLLCSFPGIVTINPIVHDNLPYDPSHDLVPVVSLSDNFIGIAVSQTLKVGSLDELVSRARAQPGKFNWSASPGNPLYGFAALLQTAGIKMVQVPYRDFRPALQDAAEGRIQAVATGVGALLPLVQARKLSLLVVNNRQRSPLAPSVPTAEEAGYGDLTLDGLTGLYGWRDMPREIRERIAADVRAIAADPDLVERVLKIGSVLHVGTPEEFASAIEEQSERIATIAHKMTQQSNRFSEPTDGHDRARSHR
jgi:tripartite-type tricarboxylate transporter receptor subunit TctC